MARTAAAINAEILSRANAGSKISSTQVYDWMNEVKMEVQTEGSPFDFMRRVIAAVMGSGTGVPGDLETFYNSELLLPYDFHAPVGAFLMTGAGTALTETQADLVFGATATLPLWWCPSFSTHVSTGLTKTATGNTLYPLFSYPSFLFSELADRGVSIDPAPLIARVNGGEGVPGVHEVRFLSNEQGRIRAKLDTTWELPADIVGHSYNDYQATSDAVTDTPGYAIGPWDGGKKVEFGRYYGDVVASGVFPVLVLTYYAILPEYNAVAVNSLRGYTPVEDVFTRTAPRLLIYGTLEKVHEYLDDEERSQFYRTKRESEERKFRIKHAVTQVGAYGSHQRLRQGRAITRN